MAVIQSYYNAVPVLNDCFISLLNIKDEEILKIFNEWEDPSSTAKLAMKIERSAKKKKKHEHLIADLVYTFWKYSDIAVRLNDMSRSLSNKVILEQSIVAACTSYECYLKDMIPWILKNNKKAAKKFLGNISDPIKTAGKYGFDLLGNVDKIFLDIYGGKTFPIFPNLEEFYKKYFGISLFFTNKEKSHIEEIFEIRHCIVHNEGKPDKKFTQKTGKKKMIINYSTTRKHCVKIHEKLHDAAYQIFVYMKLNEEKSPWEPSEEGEEDVKGRVCLIRRKWKFIE